MIRDNTIQNKTSSNPFIHTFMLDFFSSDWMMAESDGKLKYIPCSYENVVQKASYPLRDAFITSDTDSSSLSDVSRRAFCGDSL